MYIRKHFMIVAWQYALCLLHGKKVSFMNHYCSGEDVSLLFYCIGSLH